MLNLMWLHQTLSSFAVSPDADIFMELPSLDMVALVYLKLFISSVCMLLMLISCFAIACDHEFTSVSAGIPYTFELLVCW